ncbi:DEAD/DEAH box helicase [Enterobacter asburiae]|uniref:DEAD/DEAH box helicase n=1 Tax=Enterobacter asburiae TaxID=61645 RepID=UPI002A364CA8|nr:DEAD/DEAH box helicase [Enterobacter asburiae]
MSTLAKELTFKIKVNDVFIRDLSLLYGDYYKSIKSDFDIGSFDADVTDEYKERAQKRLIETAYILSQTGEDGDKNLAQSIAYHLNMISQKDIIKKSSVELLRELGNFPGANFLKGISNFKEELFFDFLKRNILEKENTVKIDGIDFLLTDFQKGVWNSLYQKGARAISAPTSAGKSFIVLEMLVRKILENHICCAVYIAPTRALVNEICEKLSKKLYIHKDSVRVSAIPTLNNNYNKQIFVLTQERLQVLLELIDDSIDLVVIDEAQCIGDDIRGMILQDCLEIINKRNEDVEYLFLAPGANGFNSFGEILGRKDIVVDKTDYSPVVQNKLIVTVDPAEQKSLDLFLLDNSTRFYIGKIKSERGFANHDTRLAAIALALGKNSSSLVYATGAANAEKVAKQLASDLEIKKDNELLELSKFIKKHVHKDYSLASHVLKGVAYHYGKMPGLLRESIEKAFIKKDINFLVCTTTLFQGVNLPTKNVFIDTPTRGNKGVQLDSASIWNFAGRAGRLGYAFSGDVYLIGYDEWDSKPLDNKVEFKITPSFKKVASEDLEAIISRLKKDNHVDSAKYTNADAAAGLLLSKAAKGDLNTFLKNSLESSLTPANIEKLEISTLQSLNSLDLPHEMLAINWTVDPFGQERIYKRFIEVIKSGGADGLIPRHPSGDVYQVYVGIFSRINKYILNNNSAKFSRYLTTMSLNWMRGKSLPEIISLTIKHKKSNSKDGSVNVDRTVREVFEFIEDNLRFKYVQLGRAYVDILRIALMNCDLADKVREIYDFPLSLELGVSSIAGQVFIELGLSRITASYLEGMMPNSNPSLDEAINWIRNIDPKSLEIPLIILRELESKSLIKLLE